jgi:hypothetical protein
VGSREWTADEGKSQSPATQDDQNTANGKPVMKISKVTINNRRREFLITSPGNVSYSYPFAESDPSPGPDNKVKEVFVDEELGCEAVTYTLDSGEEGSIHVEQILEYHKDPRYMADLLTYKLTLEAREGMDSCGLSRRQVARRLKTSVPQLYRLLDPANTSKSINQLVTLLHVLNRRIDLVVRDSQNPVSHSHR